MIGFGAAALHVAVPLAGSVGSDTILASTSSETDHVYPIPTALTTQLVPVVVVTTLNRTEFPGGAAAWSSVAVAGLIEVVVTQGAAPPPPQPRSTPATEKHAKQRCTLMRNKLSPPPEPVNARSARLARGSRNPQSAIALALHSPQARPISFSLCSTSSGSRSDAAAMFSRR